MTSNMANEPATCTPDLAGIQTEPLVTGFAHVIRV